MAKTVEKARRSNAAAIIREMRGPLPEDDSHFELVDGQQVPRKQIELTDAQRVAVRGVLRELDAVPPGATVPIEELIRLVRRLPGRPRTWTSARTIREARGPFPHDDPDYSA